MLKYSRTLVKPIIHTDTLMITVVVPQGYHWIIMVFQLR
jgi:hypothetical protein